MPFVNHLKLEKQDDFFPSHLPMVAFEGIYNDHKVTVVTNGKDSVYGTNVDNVGTVPAAMAAFLALEKTKASLLINAGTAGGFQRKGAAIGDVFLLEGVANHDRRIPIPGFDSYVVGTIDLTKRIHPGKMAGGLGFKTGNCTTSNSLDRTEEDDKHMLSNDASVKDMEAAAIAWSCELQDTPFLGVKVVTDIVDGDKPTQEEFMENLGKAAESLQSALPKVLEYICGKEHHEL